MREGVGEPWVRSSVWREGGCGGVLVEEGVRVWLRAVWREL